MAISSLNAGIGAAAFIQARAQSPFARRNRLCACFLARRQPGMSSMMHFMFLESDRVGFMASLWFMSFFHISTVQTLARTKFPSSLSKRAFTDSMPLLLLSASKLTHNPSLNAFKEHKAFRQRPAEKVFFRKTFLPLQKLSLSTL